MLFKYAIQIAIDSVNLLFRNFLFDFSIFLFFFISPESFSSQSLFQVPFIMPVYLILTRKLSLTHHTSCHFQFEFPKSGSYYMFDISVNV